MADDVSALERARRGYRPRLPSLLERGATGLALAEGASRGAVRDEEAIAGHFPQTFGRPALTLKEGSGPEGGAAPTVGVLLSGGQAPGGHNVIAGLFDGLRKAHSGARLLGFLGGPLGLLENRFRELTETIVDAHRNSGGFDMIGSGRDKIESEEQLAKCLEVSKELALDGLVVVGGDDSNTNAAVLAEYFEQHGGKTVVTGVPKTIDGDLKGEDVEASFGFDTATRTYSELIGNIARDARSAKKYWHFIRLMGRSASHVTLECALQTRPNITLIGEEVREQNATLQQVVDAIAAVVRRRAERGLHYGVCLVPEGLIEFIPEIGKLIDEINVVLGSNADAGAEFIGQQLSPASAKIFAGLPELIRRQLLFDRDSHGNVQVSRIDTELLLTENVRRCLARDDFQVQTHFLGYEGRCAFPTNFDADYTYALGQLAAVLIAFRRNGYITAMRDLHLPSTEWKAAAAPLTSLMQIESRKGRPTPVIAKALVQLDGAPFLAFSRERERWESEDSYLYPGAIQYFGPDEVSRRPSITLVLESGA